MAYQPGLSAWFAVQQQLAAHHFADEAGVGHARHVARLNGVAVAQHNVAVGHLKQLVELVGDVGNGLALAPQRVDDAEKHLHLALADGRSGLVHDNDLRVEEQGLGNFHHLLLAHLQVANQRVGRNVELEPVEQLLGLAAHLLLVERAPAGGNFPAQKDVFRDAQVRNQVQLLVNDGNAGLLGLARIGKPHLPALEQNPPLVLGVHARQNLHQRGLAGPVLPDDGIHLAAFQHQVDCVEGDDARKPFRDIFCD